MASYTNLQNVASYIMLWFHIATDSYTQCVKQDYWKLNTKG